MNYDSAGLMAQIQALIAPPASSRSRSNNNNKHPYFKRPGRGHNHDTCDACHESGDLLCCDTCSASFHLMCVNPPLDYEQIPAGDWRCHRCLSTQGELGFEADVTKKSSGAGRRAGKKRSAQTISREPPVKKPTLSTNKRISMKEGKVVQNFFSQAVEFARKMNPEQFVLPKYLMDYGASQFPGAPRQTGKKGSAKANKQVIETENGMVPSPISICFVCDISCRRGPMIKCDACSAFFHFECLNPPLTGVPQGRWLCHLHPEPTMEHKTLKSLSLTERVRLYDYAKKPIDPIQVALKFVTKTQRAKYSYFRSKVKIRGKEFTEIPGPIVRCYNDDDDDPHLPTWPSLNELSYYNYNNNNIYADFREMKKVDSDEGQITALDLLAQVATKQLDSSQDDDKKPSPTSSPSPNALVCSQNGLAFSPPPESMEVESVVAQKKILKANVDTEKIGNVSGSEGPKITRDIILEGLDMETIYSLAAQKLRELRCNETLESNNSNPGSTKEMEPDRVLTDNEFEVKKEVPEDQSQASQSEKPECEPDHLIEMETAQDSKVEIPVPYVKLLIINTRKELTFKEGQIMIGKGQVELDLTEHVSCHSITDEHCCIYYDYVGSRWELINYSPNGTIVNKVPYGCAPSRKNIKSFPWGDASSSVKMNGIDPTTHIQPEGNALNGSSCLCRQGARPSFTDSLEGSAYLDIGSRIQIGCVRIFVVETGNDSKWVPRDWLVYSGVTKLTALKESKELRRKDKKKKSHRNSHGSGSDSASDEDSEAPDNNDDKDNGTSEPENVEEPRIEAASRKSVVSRTPPAARGGGTRGRGRGRGRGSAAARRRASSGVQGTKPVKIVPKKISTRGRKRKDSTAPAVIMSNGTGEATQIMMKESSGEVLKVESDAAVDDHDYDGPNLPTPLRDKGGSTNIDPEKIQV